MTPSMLSFAKKKKKKIRTLSLFGKVHHSLNQELLVAS